MGTDRIYNPSVEQFKRSNMDDVLIACAKEDAEGRILRRAFTLRLSNNYQEVDITEESRRICSEALV